MHDKLWKIKNFTSLKSYLPSPPDCSQYPHRYICRTYIADRSKESSPSAGFWRTEGAGSSPLWKAFACRGTKLVHSWDQAFKKLDCSAGVYSTLLSLCTICSVGALLLGENSRRTGIEEGIVSTPCRPSHCQKGRKTLCCDRLQFCSLFYYAI